MKSSRSEILPVNPQIPDEQAVRRASDTLLAGGLIVVPTDTRYGLMACADHQGALERLLRVKGRNAAHPVALLLRSRDDLNKYGDMTTLASLVADRFLPGPLTMVLRSTRNWPPPRVVNGKIGLRVLDVPLVDRLLGSVGCPLAASSANRTGQKDADSVQEIRAELGDEVDLYLDAGPLTGMASTVVDCSEATARVLREGAVPAEDIMCAAGE